MKIKITKYFFGNLITLLFLANYIPNAQATEGYFSPATIKESVIHKDTAVKYASGVFVIGASRQKVIRRFGEPNGTDFLPSGGLLDVYIFTPDGSKYVNPEPRPRNVALGIFTMGVSVAVHQSLLAYQRTGLTIYHIYYNSNDQIVKVKITKGSALKNPAK